MAYCLQKLAGISPDCNSGNKGGIKEVYIANYGDVKAVAETDGTITAITMNETAKFKTYTFRRGTANSMTSTLNVDEANGISNVTTVLSLVFTRQDTAKRIEMTALSLGQLVAIVRDGNGKLWYLGKDDYLAASAGGAETGTAGTDRNAYTLELSDTSETYPYEVSEAALADIVEA